METSEISQSPRAVWPLASGRKDAGGGRQADCWTSLAAPGVGAPRGEAESVAGLPPGRWRPVTQSFPPASAPPLPSARPAPRRRSLAIVPAPVSGAGRSPRKRKGTRTTSDGEEEEEEEEEEADQQDGPCCRSSLSSSRWEAGGGAGGGGGGRGPAAWDRVRVDGGGGGGVGCRGGGDGRGDSELRGAAARTSAVSER